jgi:hypothetical protein
MLETVSDLVRDLQRADLLNIDRGYESRPVAVLAEDGSTVAIGDLISFPGDTTVYLRLSE